MTTKTLNSMIAEFERMTKVNGTFILNDELKLKLEQKGHEYGVSVKIFA